MDPVTITCEVCGQAAIVLTARYKYVGDGPEGRPAEEYVLTEIERQVDCPKCGVRTQSERERKS
jgi:hypothetical protein